MNRGDHVHIALTYGVCALIAIGVNLLTQTAALAAGSSLTSAVVLGTATGFICKYLLDKRFVFFDRACKLSQYASSSIRYAGTAVFTTGIFWAAEAVADAIFGTALGRNLGACAGLGVGYWLKYRLDRRFVFPGAPL